MFFPRFENHLPNKRARPTKNEPQQQEISYLKRERGQAGQKAGIFKVRLGLGDTEGRDRETEIQRDIEKRDIETELTIKIPRKAGQPN